MRPRSKVVASMLAVLFAATPLAVPDRGRAQHEPTPARSARGGALARTAHYRFEVFSYPTGVRVFVADAAGASIGASALTGTATFYHPNSPDPWFARPLRPAAAPAGGPAESLDLAMDLGTVPTSGATVTIEIRGLPDPKEPAATFAIPFAPVEGPASVPAQAAAGPGEEVHYFPVAGFYRMTSGALIWVPGPGYYYGTAAQYYPRSPAPGWQPALPGAGPIRVAPTRRGAEASESIHPELYWRPRALGDTESYEAWLHGEMWRQRLAGRSPDLVGGECARCHRR